MILDAALPNGSTIAQPGGGSEDARRCPKIKWLEDGVVLSFLNPAEDPW